MKALLLILVLTASSFGATYKGRNIDGKYFDAEVYSYSEVIIAQSVGHVNLTAAAFKKGAEEKPPAKP